jgi:DeoR family transcriptional regulator, fructose operon transcriptional repressor
VTLPVAQQDRSGREPGTPAPARAPAPRTGTRQRRDLLVTRLRSGGANIGDLAARFAVSPSTIRRDLAALADDGRVMRTYGGAVEPGHGREPTLDAKERAHWAEKDAIAVTAAAMAGRGDVVLLDAGTSAGRVGWHLRQRDGITVVTNGMSALLALADAPGIEVILLGGRLRRPNEAFLGPDAERALRRFRPDLAFLGADGVDPRHGLNCPTVEQASLKELMATTAREAWVVADHWKLTAEPFRFWALMPPGTGIITDPGCPPDALRALGGHGWKTLAAPAPDPGELSPAGEAPPGTDPWAYRDAAPSRPTPA